MFYNFPKHRSFPEIPYLININFGLIKSALLVRLINFTLKRRGGKSILSVKQLSP